MIFKHSIAVAILAFASMPKICSAAPDTVSVYFPYNVQSLTEQATARIDDAIYKGQISEKEAIQIIGYTDEIGTPQYNLKLSRERANSVKNYLIKSGYSKEQITLVLGKGEQFAQRTTNPDGTPADRRVDIVRGPKLPPKSNKDMTVKFIPGLKDTGVIIAKQLPRKSLDAQLKTVSIGETLVLDDIFFLAGRHVIRPESEDALAQLYNALAANPTIRVSIEGHVCCIPQEFVDANDDDTHTLTLSLNRAKAIRDYLVKRGLDSKRFECSGFGHRKPIIFPERTEDDANRNRRVELRIIK
ncbi:MAG: OmpA family protein [Chitinophagaceae bacterium]